MEADIADIEAFRWHFEIPLHQGRSAGSAYHELLLPRPSSHLEPAERIGSGGAHSLPECARRDVERSENQGTSAPTAELAEPHLGGANGFGGQRVDDATADPHSSKQRDPVSAVGVFEVVQEAAPDRQERRPVHADLAA